MTLPFEEYENFSGIDLAIVYLEAIRKSIEEGKLIDLVININIHGTYIKPVEKMKLVAKIE